MTCDFCGALLPEALLICPRCGRLVHGKRLASIARDADELEQRGEPLAAKQAWELALQLLPESAMQASEIRARIAKLGGQAVRGSQGSGNMGRAAGVAGGVGALLLGLKSKVGLVLAFAKSSKILLTGLTMLVSIWAYTQIMGFPFAALFVVLIWVHEMGHVIVLRGYGVPASAPVFIPFMGALVRLKQEPKNVLQDAWCGLGGPLLGSAGALVALAGGRALGSDLLLAVGHVAIAINLFNLTPIYPLDGGRAAQVLTPPLWGLSLAALVAFAWHLGEPLLVLAAFLPLGRILSAARAVQQGGPAAEFHDASVPRRLVPLAVYLGLAAFLIAVHGHFEPELKKIREKHRGRDDLAWITSETG